MSSPPVSAVIPHYGDAQPTIALIDVLKSQTYQGELEIIVSDDNSPSPFPPIEGVKVVHRNENGGFGRNVNTGAAAASGKWLMVLNSDLELSQNFVEKIIARAEQCGNAIISPQVVGPDGDSQYVARKFPTSFYHAMSWFTPLARIRNTKLWHRLVGHDVRATTGRQIPTDWVVGACMILPLAKFREVGGFDERFFMNSEEVDLQRRLKDVGCPAMFEGSVEVIHEGGGSSDDTKRRKWLTDSWFLYANKWSSEKQLKAALILTSVANLGFNATRRLRNRAVKPLQIFRQELEFIGREKR